MCIHTYNRTSCAQVHELPQSHCGDNREGILFYIYIYPNGPLDDRHTDTQTHRHTHSLNHTAIIT